MATDTAEQTIDVRGTKITTFIVYQVVVKLNEKRVGETLTVLTDKYRAIDADLASWCETTRNRLISSEDDQDHRVHVIEKRRARKSDQDLAVVVSNGGLLDLLSPLGFALAAALTGADVAVYLQGPAVRALKRGYKGSLPGLGRPFSAFARRGLSKIGHIPVQEKLAQLRELGARIYVCEPSMDHFGVKTSDLVFDDIVISEYITFMAAMQKADVHIYS